MAAITSPDGNYTANVTLAQDPTTGVYVVDINVTTANPGQTGDTINVRVNGSLVWEGLATEATGG